MCKIARLMTLEHILKRFRRIASRWGAIKTRNGEITKWRNGTKDKSQSCKIAALLKLKLLFHGNLHLFEPVGEFNNIAEINPDK